MTHVPPEATESALAAPIATNVGHPSRPWRFALRYWGVEPVALLVWCAARIGLDYAFSVSWARREVRRVRLEGWQSRSAARGVAALGRLKGAFAKAGQFAAIRHDLLPTAVTGPLEALRDRVPPLPFRWIRETLESELGGPIESQFERFSAHPIGAASVAQVHRATLPGGIPVAVKVQYPWLAGSVRIDMVIVRRLLRLGQRLAPRAGFDLDRIVDEFERGLAGELDFEREAQVAAEIRSNLSGDDRIAVPRVYATHCSRRVLTMEYFPTVRVDDAAGLERLGVAPAEVLQLIGRSYAKQVFVDGLFHADPHPGNLFVVDEPGAAERPRLLFVDFGLSRRLDPVLRDEMRSGVYALLQRDLDSFIDGMRRMQMIAPGAEPAVRDAVRHMFDRIGTGGALQVSGSQVLGLKDEAKLLLQETEGLQLPNDLLLYAKTLSYVFAIGERLAPEQDLMKLILPYLLKYLAQKPAAADSAPAPEITASGPAGAAPGAG